MAWRRKAIIWTNDGSFTDEYMRHSAWMICTGIQALGDFDRSRVWQISHVLYFRHLYVSTRLISLSCDSYPAIPSAKDIQHALFTFSCYSSCATTFVLSGVTRTWRPQQNGRFCKVSGFKYNLGHYIIILWISTETRGLKWGCVMYLMGFQSTSNDNYWQDGSTHNHNVLFLIVFNACYIGINTDSKVFEFFNSDGKYDEVFR